VKVAITGTTGFLGNHFANFLTIHGIDHLKIHSGTNLGSNSISYSDLCLPQGLSRLADCTHLVHFGWGGTNRNEREDALLQDKNLRNFQILIRASQQVGIRHFIGIGSQDEFGTVPGPWTDDSPQCPKSEYGLTKIRALNLLRASNLNFTWLRIFSVYGPMDKRAWLIPDVVNALNNSQPINLGPCENLWEFTHIDDIDSAVLWVITRKLFGVINLSNGDTRTLRVFLEILALFRGKSNLLTFSDEKSSQRSLQSLPGLLSSSGWTPKVKWEYGVTQLFSNLKN
jgi:nucleoside-diphosphate-sugar epimerase